MSIATVVTRGYGSFGSVNKIPTLGYSQGVVVPGISGIPKLTVGTVYHPGVKLGTAHTPGFKQGQIGRD